MPALAKKRKAVESVETDRIERIEARFPHLASAAAESLIMIVVPLSRLPVFPQHMQILRCDMFRMHLLIPVPTAASFPTNDPPIGTPKPGKLLHGTRFIFRYAAPVLALILTEVVFRDLIPVRLWTFSRRWIRTADLRNALI